MINTKKDKKQQLNNSINHLVNAKTIDDQVSAIRWALVHLLQDLKAKHQTEPQKGVSQHSYIKT